MQTAPATFDYHRSIAPMMWAFAALAVIELVVVHLFVALRWPWIGWPLSIVSAAGVVWLVVFIASFKKRPHRLEDGVLHLHAGIRHHLTIPLENISRIAAEWEQGAIEAGDAINLALIAHPNPAIHLVEPLGKWRKVFVRLDDPARFDAALSGVQSLPV